MTKLPEEWEDKEYREAYMEAAVNYGLAWQIKSNREMRRMGKEDLYRRLKALNGKPCQIKILEDAEIWGKRLRHLKALAKAFDCALLVKFVPYSKLAEEYKDLSPTDLFAAPYAKERAEQALQRMADNAKELGLDT